MAVDSLPPYFYPPVELQPDGSFVLTQPWHAWTLEVSKVVALSASAPSSTVTLAKITGSGADGSLTVTNGIITAIVAPT